MQITKQIRLDFARSTSPVVVFAKQGDIDTRYVSIEPLQDGAPYLIPDGVHAAFGCRKPDGHQVLIDGATSDSGYPKIEDGKIIVELTEQTLAAAGDGIAAVMLVEDTEGRVLSTQNFILRIERNPLIGAQIESTDEYQAFIKAVAMVSEAVDKANEAIEAADKAVDAAKDATDAANGAAARAEEAANKFSPVEATEEMTQPVGVSESGQLFTTPSYSKNEIDAIMGSYISDIDSLVGGDE